MGSSLAQLSTQLSRVTYLDGNEMMRETISKTVTCIVLLNKMRITENEKNFLQGYSDGQLLQQ